MKIKYNDALLILSIFLTFVVSTGSYAQTDTISSIDKKTTQAELLKRIKASDNKLVIIDVRTKREFYRGHIPTAINLPHRDLLQNINLLNEYKNKDIVLYCHSGVRVGKVLRKVMQSNSESVIPNESRNNPKLIHLLGDYRGWHAQALPIEHP